MSFRLDKPTMFSVDGYKRHSKDVNNKHNIIASGDITMEDVDFPVHGIDNLGNEKIMEPGKDYSFPGDIVLETPLKKSNMGYGKKHDSSHKKYEDVSFKMSGFPMHSGTKEYKSHLKQKPDPAPEPLEPRTIADQSSYDAMTRGSKAAENAMARGEGGTVEGTLRGATSAKRLPHAIRGVQQKWGKRGYYDILDDKERAGLHTGDFSISTGEKSKKEERRSKRERASMDRKAKRQNKR